MLPLLFACDFGAKPLGVIGHAGEGFGGAVSEEPAAALIARDALSAGGTAADAAVALYFGLAVTYPIAAALGGGGMCVVHSGDSAKAEVLDFLPRPDTAAAAGRTLAIPSNVRGMAALHARYGRLRWEQLVLPGERAARFGNRISRALARASRPEAARLAADPTARAIFLRRNGAPLDEGDSLEQVSLATTIGQIRARGAGALYGGSLAKRLASGAASIGMTMPVASLRNWIPTWREPETFKFGDHTVALVAGSAAAGLWRRLSRGEADTPAGTHEPEPGPHDHGTTGFVVMDRNGGAVACGFSMNGPFGTGRIIPGTGVFASSPASAAAGDGFSLAIIFNQNTSNAYFAVSASGGPASARVLAGVSGAVLYRKAPLKEAVAARRPGVGRVNAIYCPEGIRRRVDLCRFQTDPRGFGYAVSAQR